MPNLPNHHWSTTFDASSENDDVSESLRRFLDAFWFPAFAFARRQSSSATEARDRLQAFAARFVSEAANPAANANPATLRTILLAALTNHDWQAADSADVLRFSEHDWAEGQQRFEQLQLEAESVESAFHRSWVWTLQNRALSRLRKEFSCDGRAEVFAVVDDYLLADEEETPWSELAESCHMSVTALKTTASRMQERLQTLIKREVAQTTASQTDAAVEFELLFETGERDS